MNFKVMTAAEREARMRRAMRGNRVNIENIGSGVLRARYKPLPVNPSNAMATTFSSGSGMRTILSGGPKRTEIQSPQRPQARLSRPKKDDGIGEAMSPGQRANFIKGINKGYKIKTTPAGATYGVRTTV
jgi:hypothetical protein